MTSRDLAYWLQGYFEILEADMSPQEKANVKLTAGQVNCIKRHLAMVFHHEIDPSFGDKKHQDALSSLHKPGPLLDKINC